MRNIKEILPKLLTERGISPDKIVVFGSYASGGVREDSDIDIIVVSSDFREKDIFERVRIAKGVHRKLVDEIMKPFDIMYYSDEEWERGASLVINSAKEYGEVIHSIEG